MLIVLLVAHVLVSALIACRLGTYFAWEIMRQENRSYPSSRRKVKNPTPGDWIGAGFIGLVAGAIWPALLLLWGAYRLLGPMLGRTLFAPPKAIRDERLRERVAELEKELDLR